ncbi:transcription termination factor 1, mitochondrial [Sceloporus undulatus]|uniref:transcription termination factor 1, mitochondrial n=1 Tax=Sceloporus undulatus TaxID=8520 RepID=UPI001C4A8BA1|nr:transcription termination factor 1, mitochondrial [Sceloporus undulatus]XP_042327073.1 transcription termination factor 1, mitochondrial [Sceloporus undulatus]XP_042327074.1 transcription termination factor 1, mitochondrial [Sceloporus undulatus]XP_042327075.1 transcription termination factor 1, mitochondrial [Sceloporus undulatus]
MRRLMNMENKLLSRMSISCFITLSTEIIFRRSSLRLFCHVTESSSTESEKENGILINNLMVMGVDIKMVRKRQPGVLKRQITNEDGLKKFLQAKGANREAIASIISRYPRSIIRSYQSLNERWEIWRSILMSDLEIVTILKRSPESFFRSGNNTNMQKNIALFSSLGLTSKDLGKMLTRVPRVFSNSTELNDQIINLLSEIYVNLGGENPDDFVKEIISRNVFILLRSSKQVKANIQFLQSSFNLDNDELLTLLHGQGGDILDLSNEYLKKTLGNVKDKLLSHGCTETEVNTFVLKHLRILYLSPQNLNEKIDFLLHANISLHQMLRSPLIFDKSLNTISSRIYELEKADYNFGIHGIGIIALSKQRFKAKLETLQCA